VYQPYGELLQTGTSTQRSSFGFAGEYTDKSGLLYLCARYANLNAGMLISRDPVMGVVGEMSIRWNAYSYAGGNPVNYTDASGRLFFMPILIGAVVGAALGGAINMAMQLGQNGGRWDCINQQDLGMAMLEGMVFGAIGGAVGGFWAGLAVDFVAGTAWDMAVHQKTFGEAVA
jgi:RHS repeat-associated protein